MIESQILMNNLNLLTKTANIRDCTLVSLNNLLLKSGNLNIYTHNLLNLL